jgi:hypothetical protein
VDGLTVTVSRTSSTTFAGSVTVTGCGTCDTINVNVSCSGDSYVVTTDWTGSDECAEASDLPGDCLTDTMTVVSTSPLVITGRHCYGSMGTGPCCPAGHYDWILSETP